MCVVLLLLLLLLLLLVLLLLLLPLEIRHRRRGWKYNEDTERLAESGAMLRNVDYHNSLPSPASAVQRQTETRPSHKGKI